MKIIYTKDEIQKVIQKHFRDSHMPPYDSRPIESMTLAPDQLTIVLGDEPKEDKGHE